MREEPLNHCDVLVIGSGLAGMSGALFAARRGLSVLQIGTCGESVFASGLLDLLAVHPAEASKILRDPWEGLEALRADNPFHPYSRIPRDLIAKAFEEVVESLDRAGLTYLSSVYCNSEILTSLATPKLTYYVPSTMWNGIEAFKRRSPTLIVDFHGLVDFSALHFVSTLRELWSSLRHLRVSFPGGRASSWLDSGEMTSREFESEGFLTKLAKSLGAHVKGVEYVGLPPVCGIRDSAGVIEELEKLLGVRVFEIPTVLKSTPAIRLQEAFERAVRAAGGVRLPGRYVKKIQQDSHGFFEVSTDDTPDKLITCGSVLLATGRFIGGGLKAGMYDVSEPLLNLRVCQPPHEGRWHRDSFFDPLGHPVNMSGVETDSTFRPFLDRCDCPVENLFAVGSMLAHQDWMRSKCGSGLAIATSYVAVQALLESIRVRDHRRLS